jgi:HK97 family phage major capsid protein
MSDKTDLNGHPVEPPEGTSRREHWMAGLKGVREANHIKYWVNVKQSLLNEMQAVVDQAETRGSGLTPGQEEWYARTKSDLEWVQTRKLGPLEQRKQEDMAKYAQNATWSPDVNFESHRARLEQLQMVPGALGRRFIDLFPGAGDSAGFRSGEEFLRLVASGMSDERVLRLNAASHLEGSPSAGGYAVPEQLSRQWLDAALESEIVRPRASVMPMTTSSLKVMGFDVGDMSTSSPFGFKGEWSMEDSAASPQVAKFRMIELHAKKLKLYSEISSELVADGGDIESQVGSAMVQGLAWSLDDAFLSSGTGAAQPLSVLNDPSLVTVGKEAGQVGQSIIYENITKMYSRLHPTAMKGAVWVASSTTLPMLLSLYIGTGTSGTIAPAVREADGNFTLLGLPLLFTEKLPVLGSKGDLLLVNFSHYVIGLRKEIALEKSNAPGWARDVLSYRTIVRVDGMGKWNKAQTPKAGDSRSWCVALAAR